MVTDSFFLYNKSSIIMSKFVTELNKNVDLYVEFPKFVNLLKPKEETPLKFKKDIQKNHSHFSLPKKTVTL